MAGETETMEDTIGRLLDGGDATDTAPVETEEAAPEVEAAPDETETEAPAETEEAEAPARERDEAGRFKAKPAEAAAPKVKPAAQPTAETAPAEPPKPAYRAPQSWKPGAREALAKAPPEVQAEAARLDREYRGIMAQNAELRRQHGEVSQRWQSVEQFIRPFEGLFRAQNQEPLDGVANLVQTYAALHYAAPQQKAAILAGLIGRFSNVDDVNSALQGQPAQPQVPQWRPPQPQHDPRALVREEFQSMARAAQEAKASREFEAFRATNPEFLDDVADDVMAILDAAAQRGRPITYPQAYEYALRMPGHEDIQAILAQRKASEAAKKQAAVAAKARIAASSVRSSPSVGAPAQPKSLHDEVAAQYEALVGR